MSAGNAGACIGLANTVKQGPIGAYVQDVGVLGEAGPECDVNYLGTNGATAYSTNVLGELTVPDFIVPANSGVATGKTAQWVTNTALLAAGSTQVSVSAGVASAGTTHNIFFPIPDTGLPANSFFWAFLV